MPLAISIELLHQAAQRIAQQPNATPQDQMLAQTIYDLAATFGYIPPMPYNASQLKAAVPAAQQPSQPPPSGQSASALSVPAFAEWLKTRKPLPPDPEDFDPFDKQDDK
jgi:hypothetical protein